MKRSARIAIADQPNSNCSSIFEHKDTLSDETISVGLDEIRTPDLNSVDCGLVFNQTCRTIIRSKLDGCRTPYSSQVLPRILVIHPQRSCLSRPYQHINRRSADQHGVWTRQPEAGVDLQRLPDRIRRFSTSSRMVSGTLRTSARPYHRGFVVGCCNRSHSTPSLWYLARCRAVDRDPICPRCG